MKFEVTIDNIGKLKNASISVRPLTILAGPNNTGKSFFSKTLYSVFDAINTNPIHSFIKYNLTSLQKGLRIIQLVKYGTSHAVIRKMRKSLYSLNDDEQAIALIHKDMSRIEKLLFIEKIERPDISLDHIDSSIIKNLEQIINSYSLIIPLFEKEKKKEPSLLSEKLIDGIKKDIENLKKLIKDARLDIMFSEGFSKVLQENLTGNFQIPSLNKIKGDADNSASINISDIGKITINSDIKTDISLKGFAKLKNTSRVIYIESPFYWKQQKALLLSTRRIPYFSSSERRRLLIPKFFEDLSSMLMEELSGDMAFPDIFESLTKNIGGKIITDETGSLQFKEFQGKTHTLPIMATGVVQLAMIALLIEKKVLDKNSILFIDEPETNLHPAWQVKMIKVLFELAKAGVNIVVATHSADIMKYLEVIPNSEKENMIALNHLQADSTGHVSIFKPERSIEEKIKAIKKELAEPYTELFIQGRQDDV